ncbi:hypothetical protein [Alkalilimnicola ehrlichii]|uniref:hypothetical protein n=1 Tax=Alkalilimnicola ehrlichii TaxID=351052 RepID=UPI000E2FE421|nr:hypothetical protein [Alkalilimnicola ehrlichii]
MEARAWIEPEQQCRIELIASGQGAQWNQFVARHPYSSIYHRYEWAELIESLFGHRPFYWGAFGPAGELLGVLPLIRLKSRLFGDYQVSMPYFNYGGALADTPALERDLMERAVAEAARLGLSHVEFRDTRQRVWPGP